MTSRESARAPQEKADLRKNPDSDHWKFVEETAKRVDAMPQWKQNTVAPQAKAAPRDRKVTQAELDAQVARICAEEAAPAEATVSIPEHAGAYVRIGELESEVAELQAQVDQLCGDLKAMQTDCHNEHKKVERLTRALRVYENIENWSKCSICDGNHRPHFVGPVAKDGGIVAREALADSEAGKE